MPLQGAPRRQGDAAAAETVLAEMEASAFVTAQTLASLVRPPEILLQRRAIL